MRSIVSGRTGRGRESMGTKGRHDDSGVAAKTTGQNKQRARKRMGRADIVGSSG